MNISSRPKANIIPTPEFREILFNIKNLKREVTRFGRTNEDNIQYNRVLKRFDALEDSLHRHYSQLNRLEQALITAASTKLTEKQRVILRWLMKNDETEAVYTVLIQQLSEELGIPESTVRWNLKGLREAELIKAGDKDNKGIPVSLTDMGRIMAGYTIMSD